MDLADCGSPETLVAAILKHHPALPRPVPIEDIAREVGIQDIQDLDVEGFEGGLLSNPEKSTGIVMVKLGMAARRRRFTIGHELGHFLVPTHQGMQQCTKMDMSEARRDTPYRRQEAEANRFSAALLMPKPSFTLEVRTLGSADVSHIRALGDMYDTSMEATAHRYVELSREDCAIVFALQGRVRYVRPSRSFPKMAVTTGGTLPVGSATARAGVGAGSRPWAEVDGAVWLQTEWGRRPPRLLEQPLVQSNGYTITLLLLDADEQERDEEAEELETRWKVGFGGGR
jgi:Zn-dependent peptidase ImmA (M78 family)